MNNIFRKKTFIYNSYVNTSTPPAATPTVTLDDIYHTQQRHSEQIGQLQQQQDRIEAYLQQLCQHFNNSTPDCIAVPERS
ncbi:hypothetical protein PVK06_013304 [Gossypium arboreum]|uniref:Uncharacterized protein n=1 Tax=Gossypium arboreum TaxID=29729 RepID=A0ABR0QE40_GOSAR|nr:hypothetical protein PVK06_013304 [Gossypium arboreum]